MIICPKCGCVRNYYLTETVRHALLFDENGNAEGETDGYTVYGGKTKRCIYCNSKVYIQKEEQE